MANENININLNVNSGDGVKSLRQMRQELKDLNVAMDAAAAAGDKPLLQNLQRQFGELKNDIKDLNQEMKFSDPGEFLAGFTMVAKGAVAGFGAATGAMELFGASTEDVQEVQKKSMVIIQTLQSLEEVRSLLEAKGAVRGLANSAMRVLGLSSQVVATEAVAAANVQATATQWSWNAAMLANPIGIVIAAIVALGAAIYGISELMEDDTSVLKTYNDNLINLKDNYRSTTEALAKAEMELKLKKGIITKEDYDKWIEAEENKKRLAKIYSDKRADIEKLNLFYVAETKRILDEDADNRDELLLQLAKNKGKALSDIDQQTKLDIKQNTALFLANNAKIEEEARKEKLSKEKENHDKSIQNAKQANEKKLADAKQLLDLQTELIADEEEKELARLTNKFNEEYNKAKSNKEIQLALEQNYYKDVEDILDKYTTKKKEADAEEADNKKKKSDEDIAKLEADKQKAKEHDDYKRQLKLDSARTDEEEYQAELEIINARREEELAQIELTEYEKYQIKVKYDKQVEELYFARKQKQIQDALEVGDILKGGISDLMSFELEEAGDNEEKKKAIRKKYAGVQALIDIATTTAQVYMAASAALSPPPIGAGPILGPILAGVTIASGMAKVALVAQQYQKIMKAEKGMFLKGPSHTQGGIMLEAEGGEAIINKRSMAIPAYRSLASAINVAGGGIAFANNTQAAIVSTIDPATVNVIVEQVVSRVSQIPVIVTEYDITKMQRKVKVNADRSTY